MPNIGNVTQQVVVTTPPGESLQSAFVKINDNFANVWVAGPVGSNVRIANNSINTLNTNGGLVLNPNGIGNVVANAHVIPDQTRIRNLGSPTNYWNTLYTWYGNIQNATIGSAAIGNATIANAAISNIGNITIGVANLHITGGTNGYVLQTDGAGNLTWTAQSGGGGGGTPGGANTQVQYNNAGSFGGSAGFTFNNAQNLLSVANVSAGLVFTGNTIPSFVANTFGLVVNNGDTPTAWIGRYDPANVASHGYLQLASLPQGNGASITTDSSYFNITNAGSGGIINLSAGYLGSQTWTFNGAGKLTTPGEVWVQSGDSYNSVVFTPNGTDNNGQIKVDGGQNMVISSNSNFYVKRVGQDRIAVTDTTADFMAATNVRIQSNKTGTANIWTFDTTGNLTLPSNSSNINYANGVSILDGLGGGSSYGDSNVVALLGDFGANSISMTGSVTANTFDTNGNLYIGDIGFAPGSAIVQQDATFLVYSQGANAQTSVGWATEVYSPGNVARIDFNVNGSANVDISTGNAISPYAWTFDNTGNFTAPGAISAVGNVIGGNITTSGIANLNSVIMSQSISWPDYSGSEIYEDGGLVINGPGGVYATGNIAARFEFNDGVGNSSGLYSDIGNSLVYSVGNVIVRSNNLSQTDWTFDTTGNLNLPQGGWIGAAGIKGDGTMLTGGRGQLASLTSYYANTDALNYSSCVTVNADGTLNITTYGDGTGQLGQWSFTGANLQVPGNGFITTSDAVGGLGGNSITIQAGAADQGSYSTNPGGNINITGGLGAFNDGGGGGQGGSINITAGLSSDPAGVAGNVTVNSGTNTWTFDNTGDLTVPRNILAQEGNDLAIKVFNPSSGGGVSYVVQNYQVDIDSRTTQFTVAPNDIELTSDFGGNRNQWIFGADASLAFPNVGNVTTAAIAYVADDEISFGTGTGNISIWPGDGHWTFDTGGNLTLPSNSSSINYPNGSPYGGSSQSTGSWTVTTGTHSYSFTVTPGNTYTMWVNGNIPNGIIVWNATVTVTNTNVPVIGQQFAWYYAAGNALVLTSIPSQIIGTAGSISNSAPAVSNTNVFTFSITNNSGSSQTVSYGWTKIS
jgi:hypothetical protein